MAEMLHDVFLHSLVDCVKLFPFLFLTYLLLEYLETKKGDRLNKVLEKQSKYNFIVGAGVGLIPQCGISAIVSKLYSRKIVTAGMVVAVFLSTSDGALPILLATGSSSNVVLPVILIKLFVGIVAGLFVDTVLAKGFRPKPFEQDEEQPQCDDVSCGCGCNHDNANGIVKPALWQTIHTTFIIFLVTMVISLVVHLIGADAISAWLAGLGFLQIIAVAIFGLIPNCAVSVMLAQFYISGIIPFSALVAGLCTTTGIGLIVLAKTNRNWRENVKIIVTVFAFSVLTGIVLYLFGF